MDRGSAGRSGAVTAVLVGLVIAGGVLLNVLATDKGGGVSPDSVTYLHSARNLVEHRTLVTASDRRGHLFKAGDFPPLYPLALAAPGLTGVDVAQAARWSQALFVGGSGVAFALLLRRFVRPAAVVAGVAAFVLSSGFLVDIGAFVLSDSLFLCLALTTLAVLLSWLDRPGASLDDGRWGLAAAAVIAGAATTTRFVGVALVATLAVTAGWMDQRRSRWSAALAVAVGSTPLVAWTVVAGALGQSTLGNRALVLHPPGARKIGPALADMATWVVPQRLVGHLPEAALQLGGLVVLLALVALVTASARSRSTGVRRPAAAGGGQARRLLGPVIATFVVAHIAVVLFTVSVLDAAVPLDRRILLPVYAAGLLLAVVAIDAFFDHRSAHPAQMRPLVRAAVAVALATVLLANGVGTAVDVAEARRDGLGFTSVRWRCSPVVAAVRHLRPGVRVYSNAPGALFVLTGTRAQSIVPRAYGNSRGANAGYRSGMTKMVERVRKGWSVVAWFLTVHRPYSTSRSTLESEIGSEPLIESTHGALFAAPTSVTTRRLPAACR